MLVTAVLPFCDFRRLADASFARLRRPEWPSPKNGYVRGIGEVRRRLLRGFDSWVGESSLVCGVPAMAIELPRQANGMRFRMIRKACYFDNMVNGRIEFLVRIDPEVASFEDAGAIARYILGRPVRLRGSHKAPAEPLGQMGRPAARLWAQATVKHGTDPLMQWMRVRQPIVVIETEQPIEKVEAGAPAGVSLTFPKGGRPFELFTIYPGENAYIGRLSGFRSSARTVRTYVMRMLQDLEALSKICELFGDRLDDDRVQAVFNEYTRHIMRSRAKVQDATGLADYCYASFGKLYPGHISDLRTKVIASNMRPNVRAKLLELLEEVEKAVVELKIEGDVVMRDKYENIEVKGSQGVAFGGSQVSVSGSVNQAANADLVAALRELAEAVRKSDNADAETEATLIKAAADKAEKGDEQGAAGILKKVGNWALGIGTTVGTAALTAFLKTHGIG